eukprot:TRINITY_DN15991_c4_g1_i1.p1 TRINITY_DN15991_c4_g1~~TRINITY_DN15991_c4_g1_i1.p1  ORF type:complete len:569 (+),score=254.87 TRINITY_DN15991_c4_g1_i1:49-1755(+)
MPGSPTGAREPGSPTARPWYPAGAKEKAKAERRRPQPVWHVSGAVAPKLPRQPWTGVMSSRARTPSPGSAGVRRKPTKQPPAAAPAPEPAPAPAAPEPVPDAEPPPQPEQPPQQQQPDAAPPAALPASEEPPEVRSAMRGSRAVEGRQRRLAAARSHSYAQPTASSQRRAGPKHGQTRSASPSPQQQPGRRTRRPQPQPQPAQGGGWSKPTAAWARRADRSRGDTTWAQRDFWPPAADRPAPRRVVQPERRPAESPAAAPPERLLELRLTRPASGMLGLVYGGGAAGLRIVDVVQGSAADAAGAREGQEIVGVNAARVRTRLEADAAFAAAPRSLTLMVCDPSAPPPQQPPPPPPPPPQQPASPPPAAARSPVVTPRKSLSPVERLHREMSWREPMSPGRGALTAVERYEMQLRDRHARDLAAAHAQEEEQAAEAKALAVLAMAEREDAELRRRAMAVAAREAERETRRGHVRAMREEARQKQASAGREAASARNYAKEAGSCGGTPLPGSGPFAVEDAVPGRLRGVWPAPAVDAGPNRGAQPPAPEYQADVSRSVSPHRMERPRWRM